MEWLLIPFLILCGIIILTFAGKNTAKVEGLLVVQLALTTWNFLVRSGLIYILIAITILIMVRR